MDYRSIRQTDGDRIRISWDNDVCTAVGNDAVIGIGGDPLFPQADNRRSPGRRRQPLAIGVRFIQDEPASERENGVMNLRVDVITLAVPDLSEAHAFYVDRLGWEPAFVVPGEITFLRAGARRVVGLFARENLERDIGDGGRIPPFDLGQGFNTTEEVDAATAAMAAAGATIRKPPQRAAFFPGYHAYVEAPDGTVWELVHNPGSHLDSDGLVRVGDIEI